MMSASRRLGRITVPTHADISAHAFPKKICVEFVPTFVLCCYPLFSHVGGASHGHLQPELLE